MLCFMCSADCMHDTVVVPAGLGPFDELGDRSALYLCRACAFDLGATTVPPRSPCELCGGKTLHVKASGGGVIICPRAGGGGHLGRAEAFRRANAVWLA